MHGDLRRRHHEANPRLSPALGEELQRDEPARLSRGHVGDAALQHGGLSHLDRVDALDQVHQDLRWRQEGQDEVRLSHVFLRLVCMEYFNLTVIFFIIVQGEIVRALRRVVFFTFSASVAWSTWGWLWGRDGSD